MRQSWSHVNPVSHPVCLFKKKKSIFRVLYSASCLAAKCPGHGSMGRRCSCEAPVRTGLCVIRHAVKDPIDLHSNCVPVGPSEPRLSLHRSATGSHPRAGLREPEGGPVSGFAVAGCPLSPSSTYSSIHTHWHVYTHSERERERDPSVCFSALTSAHKCSIKIRSDSEGIEKVLPKISILFLTSFSNADVSVSGSLFNPSVPGCISILCVCMYFLFGLATSSL